MKLAQITALATVLLAIAPATLRADDDSEIFSDDFSTLDEAWGIASDNLRVQNNKLVLQPQPNGIYTALYQGNLFNDADIRVQVSLTQGAMNEPAAIAFWGSDLNNFYVAEIELSGSFAIYRLTNSRWLATSPWQKSAAIKQGLGQTNELRLVTQGNLATFYINGQQVAAIRGFPPDGGSELGLHAESGDQPCNWEFSAFKVLNAPPTTTPATSGGDSGPFFADDFATLDPAWGLTSDQLRVDGNKLVLQPQANTGCTNLHQGSLFDDADIRVNVSQAQGNADEGGGIVFWGDGNNSFYAALIETNGMFAILRFTSGRWMYPATWQKSDAIQQGLGQTNELRVVTQGRLASFYINGQQVTAIHGFPPAGGSLLGLHADSGSAQYVWQFSAFKVLKPPPGAPVASSPGDSDTIFSDNFATLDPAWGLASDRLRVDGNKLILQSSPKSFPIALYQGNLFGDADIRVKVSQIQGDAGHGGGITFWAIDNSSYYLAECQPDGTFSISRTMNSHWLFPTSTTQKTDAVRQGLGQTNELRVVTQGSLATFYVNGQQVTAIRGYPPVGGSAIGLYADNPDSADSPVALQFSEFKILKPPAGGPAARNPADSSVLFSDDFATLDPAWLPIGAPSDIIHVDDHKLVFAPAAGKTIAPLYQGTTFDDVDVRVTVVESQGNTDQGAGIIFWGSNSPAESYLAIIQPNGGFCITRSSNGQASMPVPWRSSDAINKGLGQTNNLRVVTKGKSATVYVNDKQVATIDGSPPGWGSMIGLFAASGIQQTYTWNFSNISVHKPQ